MRRPGVLVAGVVAVLVALLAAAVAVPSLRYGFVYDDVALVVDRQPMWELGLRGFLSSRPVGTGRHVTAASLDLDRLEAGTTSARPFHRTNILLSALLAVLVLVLTHRTGASAPAAFAGAAMFAVHPVHVDSVVWITGRSELLAAIGVVGAMLLAIRPAGESASNPWRIGIGTAVLGSLAVCSKENALCLPLLVVLARLFLGRRVAWLPALAGSLAAVALWAAWIGPRLPTFEKPVFADNPLVYAPAAERIPKALAILWQYAALLVWPHPLMPDRSHAETDPSMTAGVLATAAWIGVALAVWSARHRAPRVAFAVAWFAGAFAVTGNVANAIGTIMSERLMLLPSVALALASAAAFDAFGTSALRRRAAYAVIAAIVAVFFVLFQQRGAIWESSDVFYEAAVRAAPRSAKANYDYGIWLEGKGRRLEAEAAFGRALEIVPNLSRAAQHKAESMARRGDPSGGADVYLAYLETTPGDVGAVTNVTRLLLDAGRTAEGVRWARRLVELAPDDPLSVDALIMAETKNRRALEAKQRATPSPSPSGAAPSRAAPGTEAPPAPVSP